MKPEIGGVYLIDFKTNIGAEFSGRHYAVVLTEQIDNTCVVVPLTSKKPGKKYRHGITIDNNKYLSNPSCDKSFIIARKLREVDRQRFVGKKRYKLDQQDFEKLKLKVKEVLKIEST